MEQQKSHAENVIGITKSHAENVIGITKSHAENVNKGLKKRGKSFKVTYTGSEAKGVKIMVQLQINDRTKTTEKAVYYMENKETLQEFWSRTEI